MSRPTNTSWVDWSTRLQALTQNGLAFASTPYDRERYAAIREIAAEMLAAGSGLELTTVRGLLAQDSGYATPKVDVRGVVFRENRILLVRERAEGLWTPPGGWADVCASPAQNVIREIQEESGFLTRALKVLAIFDRGKHPHTPPFAFHVYKIFIRCELLGGQARPSAETDRVDFFGEDQLPPLSVGRVTEWQLRRMFAHCRNPTLPTDFDN